MISSEIPSRDKEDFINEVTPTKTSSLNFNQGLA